MTNPLMMLQPKTANLTDDRGGGIPETVATDVAAACASIRGAVRYHAMLVYWIDQLPSREQQAVLLLELQNSVVQSWRKTGHPKSLKLDMIDTVAQMSWIMFIDRSLPWTLVRMARIAGMSTNNWRHGYDALCKETYKWIESEVVAGTRQVKQQLKPVDMEFMQQRTQAVRERL